MQHAVAAIWCPQRNVGCIQFVALQRCHLLRLYHLRQLPLSPLSSFSLPSFCSLTGSLTLPFLSVCKNNASCGLQYGELATEVALCLQLPQPCWLSYCKYSACVCRQCQASQSPAGKGRGSSNAFHSIGVIATTTAKPNTCKCSIGDGKISSNLINSQN